jgi:hypothetical protein
MHSVEGTEEGRCEVTPMDPYRQPATEPADNPVQAMGLRLVQEVPPDWVDLFPDYDTAQKQWCLNPPKRTKRPAYVVDIGQVGILLVPVLVFEQGVIAEKWTMGGGCVSKRLPPSVRNDLLGLRDGRWFFLMDKPEGARKFPIMPAAEVARALLISRIEAEHDSGTTS